MRAELNQVTELSESEVSLLQLIRARRSIPTDELASYFREVRSLIEKKQALLVVKVTVWVLVFEVEPYFGDTRNSGLALFGRTESDRLNT